MPENLSPESEYSNWKAPETGVETPTPYEPPEINDPVPPQYRDLPSHVVEELWQPPVYADPEKNRLVQEQRSLAIAKLKEQEVPEPKPEANEQGLSAVQQELLSAIGDYLQGNNALEANLTTEEKELLDRMRPIYQQSKTANPDQPVAFQFSNPDDSLKYSTLFYRLADTLEKQKLQPEQSENGNSYGEFRMKNGETDEGAFWYSYSNNAAKQMEKAGQFEWGKERLYFDIPIDQMTTMRDLAFKVAQEQKIPIAFKHLDTEKSFASQMDGSETRFVANFASTEDARRFYEALANDQTYAGIQSDRNLDHHALNLDGKAHYASGYREKRSAIENIIKTATQNPDGSYSYTSLINGKQFIVSPDQYQKYAQELADSDPSKAWEEAGAKLHPQAQ